MSHQIFLILHGRGGSGPGHWQSHLAQDLTNAGADVRYPQFPTPDDPDLTEWLRMLRGVLEQIPADAKLTVFAHSLGSILWMHHAAAFAENDGPKADRVLLVAPPYIVREIPLAGQPTGTTRFYPPPMSAGGIAAAGRETAIVASDTDDFATFAQTQAYAAALDIPIHLLCGAGHISPFYGYGAWPWVLDWALGRAALPPLPNTNE
ncbi:alpha/beta hydrolase [Capsulimonas corticalis]|uniref:Alpha/beta hydrolase n=1 Tax=Capsulimonas corticalis TaxID=2219043 RepID=A0A402CW42_9BACT|nr:alpha/beta hydrolase [Capsulimonas corticalis]BDI34029.1 alpha/beta hydrolase [Capsulimonas corticalis]